MILKNFLKISLICLFACDANPSVSTKIEYTRNIDNGSVMAASVSDDKKEDSKEETKEDKEKKKKELTPEQKEKIKKKLEEAKKKIEDAEDKLKKM